jgi:phosphomannomutase
MKKVTIAEMMATSGVQFGTSGARGLVSDMTDAVCYAYTLGFLEYLENCGDLPKANRRIAYAGDLRASTGRIMAAVEKAIADRGYVPVCCGRIPSPAIALYGLQQAIPSIMVTGSHIPDDRNGIKFNKAAGEVLKEDEAGMKSQVVSLPDIFNAQGNFSRTYPAAREVSDARDAYIRRWLDVFPADFLRGKRIGLYQHSAVGRDLLCEIYQGLGAEVITLGRSEQFIPVDTEAIREEDVTLASGWARENHFDAILSTDGDSDRPLVADERGQWLRGDLADILCAHFCGADVVVTPVSCNTAVEICGYFHAVRRTRIGSPYVIAEMQRAVADDARCVVGYEANGGFLIASPVNIAGKTLPPLPTRDPVIVHLSMLGLSAREGKPISQLLAQLPQRFTASDRLQGFPTELSNLNISRLTTGGAAAIQMLFPEIGSVEHIDTTDGLRITFRNQEIVHLRPSGNAPELRCYAESDSEMRARELVRTTLAKLQSWRNQA